MNIGDYKRSALDKLEGNWGQEALIIFIYFIFAFISSLLFKDSLMLQLISLLLVPMALGINYHYLMIADGKEHGKEDLFRYYKTTDIFGLLLLNIVVGILTMLWAFLLIIPGIIMSIAYSLALFIKMENPEIGIMDAINTSKTWMKGNKGKYFLLELSFIGWFLLIVVGFGIPMFWVMPYYMLTLTEFYIDIRDTNKA